ncbi:MAG TPA: SURF1 family protein [Anaerolineaceae bacterium]|nr:SURF1 family protein [Anaerolineaceae bacterium]
MARQLLSLRWILTTLLVIAGVGVLIRLGVWQLDRLAQRRAFNAQVSAQLAAPRLDLDAAANAPDLAAMEYRAVTVSGTYDFEQQVALRNQVSQGEPGVHLITPLLIAGTDEFVLVDRGWIPLEDADPVRWGKYDQPGVVTVEGVMRNGFVKRGLAGRADPPLAPGQDRLAVWNWPDVKRMVSQLDRPGLPVYVQQLPAGDQQSLPRSEALELDLSEGPHQGYALQWFSFAAILAIGYPFFVVHQLKAKHPARDEADFEVIGKER